MLKIKHTGTFGNHLQLQAHACLHDTFIASVMTLYCTQPGPGKTHMGRVILSGNQCGLLMLVLCHWF